MELVEQPPQEGNEKQADETVPETEAVPVQNGTAEEEEEISMKGPVAPSATQFAAIAKLAKHVSQDSEGGATAPPPPPEQGVANGQAEEGVENGKAEERVDNGDTSLGSIASAASAAKIIKQKSLEKSHSIEIDNTEKASQGSMTRVVNAAKLVKRLTQDSIHVVPEVEPSKEALPSGLLEEEEKGACNTPVDNDNDAGEKQDANPQEGAKVPSVAALASALKMAKVHSQDAETKAGEGGTEREGEATEHEPAENREEKEKAETEVSNTGNADQTEGEMYAKENDKNNEMEQVPENTCAGTPENDCAKEPSENTQGNVNAQEPATPETTEETPPEIPPKETVGEKPFQERSVDATEIELNEQNDAKHCDEKQGENGNETAEKPEAENEKPSGSSIPTTSVITKEIKKQELCPHCVIL